MGGPGGQGAREPRHAHALAMHLTSGISLGLQDHGANRGSMRRPVGRTSQRSEGGPPLEAVQVLVFSLCRQREAACLQDIKDLFC